MSQPNDKILPETPQPLPADWVELEMRLATYFPGGDDPDQSRLWSGLDERQQLSAAIWRAHEAGLQVEEFSGLGRSVGRFVGPLWLTFGDHGRTGDAVSLVSADDILAGPRP